MSLFTSSREKRYWLLALLVLLAIFLTLFAGRPLAKLFGNQDIQGIIFVLGMLLTGTAIIVHGIRTKPARIEMVVILGLAAVYIMLFLRLGLPERSHLMEYSVLAIFVHRALLERKEQVENVPHPALSAFIICLAIGIMDECMQIFLPDRVFDTNDIIFNGFAVLMAIGASLILHWIRKKFSKTKQE